MPVNIPATPGRDHGIWYTICQGIRSVLVPDERGFSVCYLIWEPSSSCYRMMTGSPRMPMLIAERI